MIYENNHTAEEFYRLHGFLSPAYAESLLDVAQQLENVQDIDANLSEAKGCYPAEDFLDCVLGRLEYLAKCMYKGDNKTTLLSIIEELNEVVTATMQSSEYGVDEIKKARSALK